MTDELPLSAVTLELHAADIESKVAPLGAALLTLPKNVAESLLSDFLSSLDNLRAEVCPASDGATPGTSNRVIRLQLVGLDECIAAALRAVELNRLGHGNTPVVGDA